MSRFKTAFLLGFSVCNAVTTLRESVKMTDCGVFVCLMCCTVSKIPCASAVKILVLSPE